MSQNPHDQQHNTGHPNNTQQNNGHQGDIPPGGSQPLNTHDLGRQIGETVRDAVQTSVNSISSAVQSVAQDIATSFSSQTPAQKPQGAPAAAPPRPQRAYGGLRPATNPLATSPAARRRKSNNLAGIPSIVFGTIGTVGFAISSLVMLILGLSGAMGTLGSMLAGIFIGVAGLSGILIGTGSAKHSLAARVRAYYKLLDSKTVVQIDELALAANVPPAKVKKDLKRARKKGMMPDVRTDAGETCAMVGEDAYQLYLDAEKARLQREAEQAQEDKLLQDPGTAGIERFKREGQQALARIRAANDAIPGELISSKIHKLESTASKIFAYVQKHPEKLPDTRKFMDYYLPTTLKLLDKYRQYDEMEVSLPNVEKTKREIDAALDTINSAFTNLLSSLYQEDTLDVSTDIEVLQTVLQQEGLAGRRFTINTDENFKSTFEEETQ